MEVTVLRLGHRKTRDKRITTHCALVARAFGAREIILSGEEDESVLASVRDLVKNWGGKFKIDYRNDWRKTISGFKGFKVHLTMYGERQSTYKSLMKKQKKLLVVVGAEKVPSEVYKMVDANIAVGNQPHSEVAALALFLRGLLGEGGLWKEREGARLEIVPSKNSKNVKSLKHWKAHAKAKGGK